MICASCQRALHPTEERQPALGSPDVLCRACVQEREQAREERDIMGRFDDNPNLGD